MTALLPYSRVKALLSGMQSAVFSASGFQIGRITHRGAIWPRTASSCGHLAIPGTLPRIHGCSARAWRGAALIGKRMLLIDCIAPKHLLCRSDPVPPALQGALPRRGGATIDIEVNR